MNFILGLIFVGLFALGWHYLFDFTLWQSVFLGLISTSATMPDSNIEKILLEVENLSMGHIKEPLP